MDDDLTEESRSIPKQCCAATRRDGRPCTAPAMGTSRFCFAHDPERTREREAARSKGGRNKAHTARMDRLVPASLRPVLATLLTALDEVHAGTLTPPQAAAMASLAGAVVKVYTTGVMEERIAALEAQHAPHDGVRGTA